MRYPGCISRAARLLALVLLLLQSGCCTMAGMAIGSTRDNHRPEQKPRQDWQLAEIKPGTMTWVTLKDSTKIAGTLAEVIPLSQAQFRHRYDEFRKHDSASALLPAIGDTLMLLPKSGVWFRGRLQDVSCQQQDSRWSFSFSVEQIDSSVLRHYRADQVTAFRRADCDPLSGPQLASMILDSSGIIPISAIEIACDSGRQKIPVENIAHLSVPNHRHGVLTGTLIGAALDAAFISIGIASQSSPGWGTHREE